MSRTDILWRSLVAIFILVLVGFLFSRYPAEHGGGWFHQLKQPFFAPPYWLPFVMWPLVYVLMGCSAGIVWNRAVKGLQSLTRKRARQGLALFIIHIFFNLIFPVILIGYHLPIISLVDISILTALIIALIVKFGPVSRAAAYLLVPYLAWIAYAATLNAAILVLN